MTGKCTLAELIVRVRGAFAYWDLHAPDDFPVEDKMDLVKLVEQINRWINEICERSRDNNNRHLLRLCLKELGQSYEAHCSGDSERCDSLYCDAKRHFEESLSAKKKATTFVVAPDGQTQNLKKE